MYNTTLTPASPTTTAPVADPQVLRIVVGSDRAGSAAPDLNLRMVFGKGANGHGQNVANLRALLSA